MYISIHPFMHLQLYLSSTFYLFTIIFLSSISLFLIYTSFDNNLCVIWPGNLEGGWLFLSYASFDSDAAGKPFLALHS